MHSVLIINFALLSMALPAAKALLALVAAPSLFVLLKDRPLLHYPLVTLAAGASMFMLAAPVWEIAATAWIIAVARCPWRSRNATDA